MSIKDSESYFRVEKDIENADEVQKLMLENSISNFLHRTIICQNKHNYFLCCTEFLLTKKDKKII